MNTTTTTIIIAGFFNVTFKFSGYGMTQQCSNLRYYSGICLKEVRKIMKTSVKIASLWGEILMQYLPDMKECYTTRQHNLPSL
jgi:hypothetical protein